MSEEPNIIPTTRLWRWLVLAVVLAGAVALYFRDGRQVQPLESGGGAAPAASDSR